MISRHLPSGQDPTQKAQLEAAARRAQALAIGARQDIERAEEAHKQLIKKLKRQAVAASQAHWEAQVALDAALLAETTVPEILPRAA